MINYCTHVETTKPSFSVSYKDRLMFMGSCFANQIGTQMKGHGWDACVNPFGVLYNPSSIAIGLERLLNPVSFKDEDLFSYQGLFHSFMHHGSFSDNSVTTALDKINNALSDAASYLSTISCLIITFGTASVYRLKSDGETSANCQILPMTYTKNDGQTVANCHKLPAAYFDRALLTVDQIVQEWSVLLEKIRSVHASLKMVFTVSPIRHWKDGAHANQISKSILLLAQQELTENNAGWVSYFPAYELMMDELRDYRFYADDMYHPSRQAVEYIWERFCDTYLDVSTKDALKEVDSICRDIQHRPFNPVSEAYKQFLNQILTKIYRLKEKNPYICMSKEEKVIIERLQNIS